MQLEEQLSESSADAKEPSDESIIKPVQLNRNEMFNSESSPNENNSVLLAHIRNNFNRINSAVSIEEVKSENRDENCDRGVHSISDSEEEEEDKSNDMGVSVQALAAPIIDENDDDDDDVVLVNSRPRTPRPIVVSDDEDDCPAGEY